MKQITQYFLERESPTLSMWELWLLISNHLKLLLYLNLASLSVSYVQIFPSFRGCSYGGKLARLDGLARLGEMIFIPRSYGIFYLSLIKKFLISLEKDGLIK